MVAYYDFDSIRKYILVFCSQFTDVHIQRKNTDNTLLKDVKIPLIYASKNKAYYKINSNTESVGAKLPLISVNLLDMQYDLDAQKNSMYGYNFISKVDNRIKKYTENPAPYTFSFEMTIWTKRTSDMYKILQQILPQFKPFIVKRVNILPEMNLSIDTRIIYTGLRNDSETELSNSADSIKMHINTLSFDLKGFLFDPIEDKVLAKTIELFMEGTKYTTVDQYSVDDVVNSKILTLTDYGDTQVRTFDVTVSEDKEQYNYIIDLSTEITAYGENIKICDKDNEEYSFVFEYDNGEYYGYDNLVPDSLTLLKTGNVCILIPDITANEPLTLNVIQWHRPNYEFANEVINLYVDYNRSVLRDITIEEKTKNDIIYNKDSNLIIKTINGSCKIFTNKSIDSDDKYFKFGFSDLDFENGKYICGLHTESGQNYIYLKTDATTQKIEIHEVVNSVDTEKTTINAGSTISEISFDFNSGDITIDVDGQNYTFTPNITVIVPYVNWNGTVAAYLDYILGYRK